MKNTLILFAICTGIFFCHAQHNDIKNYIKTESIGGKLDLLKAVEKEYADAPFIRFGDTLYNKKDFSVLLWAAKVKALGIESLDVSKQLWEEINHRSLTEPESKAMKAGFEARF